jgi:hypothetical protein
MRYGVLGSRSVECGEDTSALHSWIHAEVSEVGEAQKTTFCSRRVKHGTRHAAESTVDFGDDHVVLIGYRGRSKIVIPAVVGATDSAIHDRHAPLESGKRRSVQWRSRSHDHTRWRLLGDERPP